MKTQITNNVTNGSIVTRHTKNAGWSRLALAALALLSMSGYAGAQTLSRTTQSPSGMTYSPTTCWVTPLGGNGCMSPQYRSGAYGSTPGSSYNANLTGNPVGDKNVLNPNFFKKSQPVLLTSINAPGLGGCQLAGLPTASVSVESRIVFPTLDQNGTCALFTYDVTDPTDAQFVAELGTTNPHVTSSPGYNGDVVIGAEDGNVYSYYWASTTLDWSFTNPYGVGFDASPTTWPGLKYVYIVDVNGDIFLSRP